MKNKTVIVLRNTVSTVKKSHASRASRCCARNCRGHAPPFQHITDRRATERVAELEQLALEPAVAPARVLGGQAEDQGLQLGADRRSPARQSATVRPLPPHELAVPLQHGLGLDEQQDLRELGARPIREPDEPGGEGGEGQLLPARQVRRPGRPPL